MPASRANRNDPCPCGSGKKFKNCCLRKGGAATVPKAPPQAVAGARELLRRAQAQQRSGRLGEAQRLYQQVLERQPREPAALFGLGQVLGRLGDPERGVTLLRRAVEQDPRSAEYHAHLASQLAQTRSPDEALRAATRAIALDRANVLAHYTVAMCHERANRIEEAIAAIERALQLAPHDANARIIRAVLARRRGDLDDARTRLESVVSTETRSDYMAWALKELGNVLDRLGEYDAAFAALERSGAERARTAEAQRLDRDDQHRLITSYRTGLTSQLLSRWRREDLEDDFPAPAFLVGFPRSGTTMTEQIMAAHPGVVTASEEPLVPAVKAALVRASGGGTYPAMLEQIEPGRITALRSLYWERAEAVAGRSLKGAVFVDKLPLHLIDIGLINVIFPEARVIVALRDPRDVCLSCLMQWFRLNVAMIHFLTLSGTAALYADVMGLWLDLRERLTLRFIQVRYEDTVTDLEGQARRILDLLGVEWNDSVLEFHRRAADASIFTPSYHAVVQKVHTRAVARWRSYARHFEPVQPILRPFVETFGYEPA
jgi:Flp pilus assembly protein TadD